MTDLETRVRDALHGEVAERPADVLLDDVRRSARRRRTRRTASMAAVAVLVVGGAVGVTAARLDPKQPAPTQRVPAVQNDIADLSVTATGERFKAVRDDGCASPCVAIWSQRGHAPWVRTGTIHDLVAEVTMAPDGRNGWAPGQTAVWSTHDSGRTWGRVSTFAYPRAGGIGIMTGPEVAWALLPSADGPRLWRTPVGSDSWTRVGLPKVPKATRMQNVLPDSRVVLGVLGIVKNSTQHVVVGDGTTWHRYSVPCYPVPQLFGAEPSTRAEHCGLTRSRASRGNPWRSPVQRPSGPPWASAW